MGFARAGSCAGKLPGQWEPFFSKYLRRGYLEKLNTPHTNAGAYHYGPYYIDRFFFRNDDRGHHCLHCRNPLIIPEHITMDPITLIGFSFAMMTAVTTVYIVATH